MLFAFAMGFILKAVGPALVMQLMFELQSKRLGTDRSELTPHYNKSFAHSADDIVTLVCIYVRIASVPDRAGMASCADRLPQLAMNSAADLPATVVAASSFDDMIAITGCGAVPPQPSESLPTGSCTSPLGPLAAAAPVCQPWRR